MSALPASGFGPGGQRTHSSVTGKNKRQDDRINYIDQVLREQLLRNLNRGRPMLGRI